VDITKDKSFTLPRLHIFKDLYNNTLHIPLKWTVKETSLACLKL